MGLIVGYGIFLVFFIGMVICFIGTIRDNRKSTLENMLSKEQKFVMENREMFGISDTEAEWD